MHYTMSKVAVDLVSLAPGKLRSPQHAEIRGQSVAEDCLPVTMAAGCRVCPPT